MENINAAELVKNIDAPKLRESSHATPVKEQELDILVSVVGVPTSSFGVQPGELVVITDECPVQLVKTKIGDKDVTYTIIGVVSQVSGVTRTRWISLSGLYRNFWNDKTKSYVRIGSKLITELALCNNDAQRIKLLRGKSITCDYIHEVVREDTGDKVRVAAMRYADEAIIPQTEE